MEITHLMKLELRTPLFYTKMDYINDDTCLNLTKYDDIIICCELNPEQSKKIEPDQGQFLGSILFYGRKIENSTTKEEEELIYGASTENQVAALPQGSYLFAQQRSAQALSRDEWLDMAIEQQKDGLWERNKLGNLLYVRYLYEDGEFVTQLFRQAETAATTN